MHTFHTNQHSIIRRFLQKITLKAPHVHEYVQCDEQQ